MPVDAKVLTDSPRKRQLDRSMAQGAASESGITNDFNTDMAFERTAKYFVYVFNIARRTFDVDRPLFKRRTLLACPEGQACIGVAKFPDVVVEKFVAAETGQIHTREYRGERVAMDLICPSNTGIDMDALLSEESLSMGGASTDLIRRGLFFSLNEVPTESEIAKARTRMEKFYRSLIVVAETKARAGKLNDITEEEHAAADYFQLDAAWHIVAKTPSFCENCGEQIKPGVAFHNSAFGLCVRDWRRTVDSGVKTKADVPEDKRWWSAKEK